MKHMLETAVVQILGSGNLIVGGGLLVTSQHVITCAHVVAAALNLEGDMTQPPIDTVTVAFPFLEGESQAIRARVLPSAWQAPHPQGGGNIAGLELLEPVPQDAAAQPVLQANTLWGHPFQAFGFSTNQNKEMWVEGHIQGNQGSGWVQITRNDGASIESGFAGTPVWDNTLNGVVGIVAMGGKVAETGSMIPTRALVEAWPLLSGRSIPPYVREGQYHFISYSRANKPLVERLISDLSQNGINIWIDKQGLKAGTRNWEQALRDAISGSAAVLLVASPESRRSNYVLDELSIAEMYKRMVYPIWVAGEHWIDCIPMGMGKTQYIDLRETHYEAGLQELIRALTSPITTMDASNQSLPSPLVRFKPRNPYKGLRSFETQDCNDFFGREEFVKTLCGHLEQSRFLAVIGASGSGKSSVVKAGVLPAIQNSHPNWLVLPEIVPGSNPIERLSLMLADKLGGSIVDIRKDLDTVPDSRGLHLRATMHQRRLEDRVVLFIDQFEELFTLTTSEDERQHFIDLLTTAATEPDGSLTIVLTMRADFDDRPMAYNELLHLLEANRQIIPPLSLTDLRDVIEKPATLPDVQMTFDDNLVAELVFEVRDQVGGLPLLQFTLDQLFERCQENPERRLTFAAYREIGGLRGALTKHAEATFAKLPSDEHRMLSRALFLRLIEIGATDQDATRRRAALSELDFSTPEQTNMMREVYNAFIDARLLTTNEVAGLTTIEVSHEALLHEWQRLNDWLNNARGDVRFQRELTNDVNAWLARGRKRDDDGLYRGLVLINAQDWAKHNIPSADEMAFIHASQAWQEEIIEAEQRRKEELRLAEESARRAQDDAGEAGKRAKLARRISVFVGLIAAVVTLFSFFSVGTAQRRVAEANQQLTPIPPTLTQVAIQVESALRQRKAAALSAAAVEVLNSRDANPELAAILAIQSLKREYSRLADETLVAASQWPYARSVVPLDFNVSTLALSTDGKTLGVGGEGLDALLIDPANGKLVQTLHGHTNFVSGIAFSPQEALVATSSFDGTVRLWSTTTGEEVQQLTGKNTNAFWCLAYAPNGRFVAAGAPDGVHLWDVKTGQETQVLYGNTGPIRAIAISPDNQFVAGGGDDKSIHVWEVKSGNEVQNLLGHSDTIFGLSYSPNGKYIASGSNDNTIRLWDVMDGSQIRLLTGHTNRVRSISFSPDSRFILSGSEDNTARIWETESGNLDDILSGHTNAVVATTYSQDGKSIFTGSSDQTVRVWDATSRQGLLRVYHHPNWVWDVSISPDRKHLTTASEDGRVRIWDLETGQQIRDLQVSSIRAIAAVYSTDGKRILTGGADGTARLWDAETGLELMNLRGHDSDVWCVALSPDGRLAATGGQDGKAVIWDLASGKAVHQLTGHSSSIWDINFSPDSKYLVTGSSDSTAIVWEVASGLQLQVLRGHTSGLWGAVFSPDGEFVLTGSYDQTAKVWAWHSGEPVHTLVGHTNGVRAVAYSPDGSLIATASDDGTARLWDAKTGDTMRILRGHANRVLGITFSQDGKLLATAGEDGSARIWDVNINDLVAFVCQLLPRDVTDDLRQIYEIGTDPTCPKFGQEKNVLSTPQPLLNQSIPIWTPIPPYLTASAKATAIQIAGKQLEQVQLGDALFGPEMGVLQQDGQNTLKLKYTNLQLRDFATAATFTNPYDPSRARWGYGFTFRDEGSNNQYRLYANADQTWDLQYGWISIAHGDAPSLKTGAAESNILRLVVKGDWAQFYINQVYVATLDVSEHLDIGDIAIGSSFSQNSEIAGENTKYEQFRVWQLSQ